MPPPRLTVTDILGFSQLAVDATLGMTGVVEGMHGTIASSPGISMGRILTGGVTDTVYGAVRGITRGVGSTMEGLLALVPKIHEDTPNPGRESMLAVVNGILGDHLAASGNPLAIPMRLRRSGKALHIQRSALSQAIPTAGTRILVLAHGLCMNDLQWTQNQHNHGMALADDLGWTSVDLHYNSGLHISINGRSLAGLLEKLIQEWPAPIRELAIIGHSAGGLVARSALYYGSAAGHRWTEYVHRLVFLGTPHHGASLERVGTWLNQLLESAPYCAPLARIGKIRSAGITDLRHGSLLDEDWQGVGRFQHLEDRRKPVPLPARPLCYAIAGSRTRSPGDSRSTLRSDGLVDVDSALGVHSNPKLTLPFDETSIVAGANHWDLLSHPEVYQRIRRWLRTD
jgi:pimeloyl-ACP methyl ester carboxylesterase